MFSLSAAVKLTGLFLLSTDIAVGAPYDDSGAGKVYIYHGSAQGIKTSPAQVGSCGASFEVAIINIFILAMDHMTAYMLNFNELTERIITPLYSECLLVFRPTARLLWFGHSAGNMIPGCGSML